MNLLLILFALSTASLGWAQGKKPEEKPRKETSKDHSAKEDANAGMDDLEKGLKKTGKAAKDGANDALNSIDRGLHDAVGGSKK